MQQPERSEIFIAVASGGYKTDFNFNNIATLTFYFFGKNSPANAIKVSAATLNFIRFSLFDNRDSVSSRSIRAAAWPINHVHFFKLPGSEFSWPEVSGSEISTSLSSRALRFRGFYFFTREKIAISLLSGCCLWTLRKTGTGLNLCFSFVSGGLNFRGLSFCDTPWDRT